MTGDWRAQFDADVTFLNGGSLQARGFRLDLPGPDGTDQDLAQRFIRNLGLVMVETVRISNRSTLQEPHKGLPAADPGGAGGGDGRLVELNHLIRNGMITYPGLPGPEVSAHLTREASHAVYAPGCEFHIGRINMVANTGTYLDTPFHRYGDDADLAGVSLASLANLRGLVVRVVGSAQRAIPREAFLPFDLVGKAVLVHTGWDRHWGTGQYGTGHPFLTADAASWLVGQGAALVGIDSLNIDDTGDGARPVLSALLAAGIPVVEHLTGLDQLPVQGFRFHAAPPRVEGMGTFPVRAFAIVPGAAR